MKRLDKIKHWQSKLRVLKDWTIESFKEQASFRVLKDLTIEPVYYSGQVHLNPEDKEACICPWDEGEEEPADYILHELLHIAMMEIESGKTQRERRDLEELFVQDLCDIIYEKA